MAMSFLASCDAGNGAGHRAGEGDTLSMRYARHLTMVDYGDYVTADFRNPWDTTRTMQTFVLVPRELEQLPAHLPAGTVVRTPLQRSIVYTSVHNSLIEELGAASSIVGVCDPQYIHNPAIRDSIEAGAIVDCGQSMTPNIEKMLMLNPDAILLSAFENANDHNKVGQIGVPIIDCIDYMEVSPLARAEWMRFFGRLYGRADEADSLFVATESEYKAIKELASQATTRPKVITDLIYGSTWNMPGARSTIGVLLADAGGSNPFDVYDKSGGVQLSPEEVLYRAADADLWLVKYYQTAPLTLSQLAADNPIYTKFRAYADGNVYGCNTAVTSYFEDSSFHPQWMLAEYAHLLHPELDLPPVQHQYFTRLAK